MGEGMDKIHEKIRAFQRKYYLNVFIRGALLTLTLVSAYFVLAAVLEHSLWLGPTLRLAIFVSFFALVAYCVIRFLRDPLRWWIAKKGLEEEQTARIIGERMPAVKDRLLNLLQLGRSRQDSQLAYASILQKSNALEPLSFESVIDLGQNRRFLRYLAVPIGAILLLILLNQRIITDSTSRIIHFNQEFSPQAPFDFIVENKDLAGFYNEDFELVIRLEGKQIPDQVYVHTANQRYKLDDLGDNRFSYTFENMQQPLEVQVAAAGFFSPVYRIQLLNRPELTGFEVALDYPAYTRRRDEKVSNAGNLEVPEGTTVRWNLQTAHALKAGISFRSDGQRHDFQDTDNQEFTYAKRFVETDQYEISLSNDASKNRDRIAYQINVIKDQRPSISVNSYSDTVLYKRVVLGGMIGDDYGLTGLELHYKVVDGEKEILNRKVGIPIVPDQPQQSFAYNWVLDSLRLAPGQQLEYFLRVWDNDGVNGRKSSQSAVYRLFVPSEEDLVTDINESGRQTQTRIDQGFNKASNLREQIEQVSERLRGKQDLDWQDRKMLEDMIQQKESLDQLLREISKQNRLNEEKKDAFTEQNERIREKAEQIQKLMDELLDEETKKLFEELQRLLKEKTDVSQLQRLLDKLSQNTNNLEKELDRVLELVKQLQFETRFDQTIRDLQRNIEEQKDLLQKTESLSREEDSPKKDKKGSDSKNATDDRQGKDEQNAKGDDSAGDQNADKAESPENLAKEQEDLKNQFQKLSERLEELRELGEEIDQADDVPSEEQPQEILNEQDQSQQNLQQNKPSQSKQNQQKAIDQMQQMQQQMEGAQNSAMMEVDMENLEALRHILHGLIKLSFDQEDLMNEFSELHSNDPRFNSLAENQLQLQDNAKVLEDSLLALAKRDPFMGSFVTREVSELNEHLDRVTDANKERRRPQAQSEMQLAMTSINNLALMLDSHFDMMMQMMANAKPGMRKGKSAKSPKQSLSQLQQQLNNKIQELKNSGKSGRELSEELAEMAAEQERIRRAMQELQEQMKKEDGQVPGGDLPSKMEQTEMDLVNKQLTDQLIKRQQEILTRLLEAEKSLREQELDDERKGETAKEHEQSIPPAFEEYLRLKEKEVELLKTVPPKLYPYYRKEVDEYFKRLSQP
ncbi:MAG TPA: DUF4175 family protein [Cyclobacteriaceae bacterium]